MKQLKIWSMMLLAAMMPFTSRAQEDFSDISGKAIFPIVNKYECSTNIEFIAADAIDGNMYAPRIPHYYRAQKMWYFNGSVPTLIQTDDFGIDGIQNWFVSFNYIAQTNGTGVIWNSGTSTQQFVFHPANHFNDKNLLYAFLWQWLDDKKNGDLYLVDVTNMHIVTKLASNIKGMERASINVFARLYIDQSEMLVITDEKTFLVFDELPSGASGMSPAVSDNNKKVIYDINGRKIETPQKGINIVKEDGNTKKYVTK